MHNYKIYLMRQSDQREGKADTKQVKVIFVGSIDAGKSSLFRRMVDDKFEEDDGFVGVDFKIKYGQVDNNPVRLCLWDTAGQERFNSLSPNYYKDSHTILVCYDAASDDEINNLYFWMTTAEQNKPE